MQQLTVATVNRGVIGDGGTKTTNQHIAGLRPVRTDPVKSRHLQIIQIEILALIPPVLFPPKIRHLNTDQMVSVTEQCVAVVHTMRKTSPGQVRHAAEFMNLIVADQPPRERRL